MAYSPTNTELSLYKWIALALPLHTVYYANQTGMPRPEPPCVSLKVLATRQRGQPAFWLSDTPVMDPELPEEPLLPAMCNGMLHATYVGTLTVVIYGDGHTQYARQLKRSLWNPAVRELMLNEDVFVGTQGGANSEPALFETSWDDRTVVDFPFTFGEFDEIEAAPVVEVELTASAEEESGATAECTITIQE